MKEGLLDEKGKPNDKTPSDWYSRYKEFTHYGQPSNGQPTSTPVVPVKDEEADVVTPEEGGEGKKKKKKKSKEPKEDDD